MRDIPPKRPPAYRFERRELPRILRRFAGEGLANREIALQVMVEKGWDTDDRELVAKVTESIKSAKRWHKGRM